MSSAPVSEEASERAKRFDLRLKKLEKADLPPFLAAEIAATLETKVRQAVKSWYAMGKDDDISEDQRIEFMRQIFT